MLRPLTRLCSAVLVVGLAVLPLACTKAAPASDAGADSGMDKGSLADAGSDQTTKLVVGAACTADMECTSGHCVDLVCCEEACDQGCQTCAGTHPGQCQPVHGPDCVIRVPEQASSLSEAIARLGEDGIIEVGADLRESVVVNTDHAIVIRGADHLSPPTIRALTGEDVVFDLERAPRVRLENLVLTEGRVGVLVREIMSAELWGLTIAGNDVGVMVAPPPLDSIPPDVHVWRCDLWNNRDTALQARGGMLRVEEARFRGNRRGVEVSGGQGFELRRSLVAHSVGEVAVWVQDTEQTVIGDTFFWGNHGWAALLIDRSDQASVSRSTFNGNAGAAIRVQRSTSVLLDQVRAVEQLDPRQNTPECEDPPAELDTGGWAIAGLENLPACELDAEETDYPEEDEYWMGNGLEIVESQDVLVWNSHLILNRGVGLLVDSSSLIWVHRGSMSLNAGGGITTQATEDLWIYGVEATFNLVFGIQIIGGQATVENSLVEWTGPGAAGTHGHGMSLKCGTIAALNNDILDSTLVGIFTSGPPDTRQSRIRIDRNRIHGSLFGIAKNEGMIVDVGTNEITCQLTNPDTGEPMDCAEKWVSMEPAPSPAPALPLGIMD